MLKDHRRVPLSVTNQTFKNLPLCGSNDKSGPGESLCPTKYFWRLKWMNDKSVSKKVDFVLHFYFPYCCHSYKINFLGWWCSLYVTLLSSLSICHLCMHFLLICLLIHLLLRSLMNFLWKFWEVEFLRQWYHIEVWTTAFSSQ